MLVEPSARVSLPGLPGAEQGVENSRGFPFRTRTVRRSRSHATVSVHLSGITGNAVAMGLLMLVATLIVQSLRRRARQDVP